MTTALHRKKMVDAILKDGASDLIPILLEAGVPPEQVVADAKLLLETKVQVEKVRLESIAIAETQRRHGSLKPLLLALSTIFVLLPLIPGIDRVATYSVACLGAVGFAAALYDVFGEKAFNAGKSLRDTLANLSFKP